MSAGVKVTTDGLRITIQIVGTPDSVRFVESHLRKAIPILALHREGDGIWVTYPERQGAVLRWVDRCFLPVMTILPEDWDPEIQIPKKRPSRLAQARRLVALL